MRDNLKEIERGNVSADKEIKSTCISATLNGVHWSDLAMSCDMSVQTKIFDSVSVRWQQNNATCFFKNMTNIWLNYRKSWRNRIKMDGNVKHSAKTFGSQRKLFQQNKLELRRRDQMSARETTMRPHITRPPTGCQHSHIAVKHRYQIHWRSY